MTGETCGTCRFWYQTDPRTKHQARCRRFPPVPVAEGDYHPTTKEYDYCGEWRAIPKPDEARSK